MGGSGLLVLATAFSAWSQTTPVLTIKALGTNNFSITVTNGGGTNHYDVLWTPVLSSPDYPWTWAAIGTPGQTNFLVNMGDYQSFFFRGLWENGPIPLWEAADPNNPGAGVLTVFIDSPTNGATISQ